MRRVHNKKWEDLGISRSTYLRYLDKGITPTPPKNPRRIKNEINSIWNFVDPEWVYRTCNRMSKGNMELYDYLLDYVYTLKLEVAENPKTYIVARLRNRIRDFIRFKKKFSEYIDGSNLKMKDLRKARILLKAAMELLEEIDGNILFPEYIGDIGFDAVIDTIENGEFLSSEFEKLRDKLLKYSKIYRKKFSWKEIHDTLIMDDIDETMIEKLRRYFRNCFSEMNYQSS